MSHETGTCLNGALPEGCTVEAGAGTLCVRGLSSAQVNDYGGCVLRDVEADGTPFYSHLDLNAVWKSSVRPRFSCRERVR